MFLKIAVWLGMGIYALLSATDWMMTHALLQAHPGAIEANPLAAACLHRYGWDGLAVFKCAGVAVVLGAVFLIARSRPAVAGGVVALGCAVLLSVTVYTHGLLRDSNREAREAYDDAAWPESVRAESAGPAKCWFTSDRPEPIATVQR
jgi:hypothetical protein